MKEAEQIIAAELTGLSIQERVHALDDLHCVGGDEGEENVKMLQKALESFQQELQKANNPLYKLAADERPDCYLNDSSYRLRFVRVNQFDVLKVVCQILNFLGNRTEYFGNEELTKEKPRRGYWKIMILCKAR